MTLPQKSKLVQSYEGFCKFWIVYPKDNFNFGCIMNFFILLRIWQTTISAILYFSSSHVYIYSYLMYKCAVILECSHHPYQDLCFLTVLTLQRVIQNDVLKTWKSHTCVIHFCLPERKLFNSILNLDVFRRK